MSGLAKGSRRRAIRFVHPSAEKVLAGDEDEFLNPGLVEVVERYLRGQQAVVGAVASAGGVGEGEGARK